MSGTPPDHLIKFLKKQCMLRGEGYPEKFVLEHDGSNGEAAGHHIENFAYEEGADISMLALEIYAKAEHYASTLAQPMQRFFLMCWMPGASEPDSLHPFVIKGRSVYQSPYGTDTEPGNEKGTIAQVLRHNNEQNRLMLQFAGDFHERYKEDLAMERQARIAAEAHNMAMRKEWDELLDKKAQREIDKQEALQAIKNKQKMLEMIFSVGPVVLAALVGRDGKNGDVKGAIRDAAVGNILGNLSPEEIAGIGGSLKGQNQLAFFQLMKSYIADDEKIQEGRQKLLREGAGAKDDSEGSGTPPAPN